MVQAVLPLVGSGLWEMSVKAGGVFSMEVAFAALLCVSVI